MLYILYGAQPGVIELGRIIALGCCSSATAGIVDRIGHRAYGKGLTAIRRTGQAETQCVGIAANGNTGWGSAG